MAKSKYLRQTRNIKVMHPDYPKVVLFEARVFIVNLDTTFVEQITKVEIKYKLKEVN
jgi:hypothetical protein